MSCELLSKHEFQTEALKLHLETVDCNTQQGSSNSALNFRCSCYSRVRHGTVTWRTAQYNTARYGATQVGAVRHGMVRNGMTWCVAVQYCTIRCIIVRHGTARHGTCGTARSRMAPRGSLRYRTTSHGNVPHHTISTVQSRTDFYGTARRGAA